VNHPVPAPSNQQDDQETTTMTIRAILTTKRRKGGHLYDLDLVAKAVYDGTSKAPVAKGVVIARGEFAGGMTRASLDVSALPESVRAGVEAFVRDAVKALGPGWSTGLLAMGIANGEIAVNLDGSVSKKCRRCAQWSRGVDHCNNPLCMR
jgi:hypothetical protein